MEGREDGTGNWVLETGKWEGQAMERMRRTRRISDVERATLFFFAPTSIALFWQFLHSNGILLFSSTSSMTQPRVTSLQIHFGSICSTQSRFLRTPLWLDKWTLYIPLLESRPFGCVGTGDAGNTPGGLPELEVNVIQCSNIVCNRSFGGVFLVDVCMNSDTSGRSYRTRSHHFFCERQQFSSSLCLRASFTFMQNSHDAGARPEVRKVNHSPSFGLEAKKWIIFDV